MPAEVLLQRARAALLRADDEVRRLEPAARIEAGELEPRGPRDSDRGLGDRCVPGARRAVGSHAPVICDRRTRAARARASAASRSPASCRPCPRRGASSSRSTASGSEVAAVARARGRAGPRARTRAARRGTSRASGGWKPRLGASRISSGTQPRSARRRPTFFSLPATLSCGGSDGGELHELVVEQRRARLERVRHRRDVDLRQQVVGQVVPDVDVEHPVDAGSWPSSSSHASRVDQLRPRSRRPARGTRPCRARRAAAPAGRSCRRGSGRRVERERLAEAADPAARAVDAAARRDAQRQRADGAPQRRAAARSSRAAASWAT